MILEHYKAVQALVPSAVKVHLFQPQIVDDAGKPRVPTYQDYPYAVLWGTLGEEFSGEPGDRTARDDPDQLDFRIRCTYVGLNGESLAIVARNVRAALNRKRLVVAGWSTSRLIQASLTEGQTDYDVKVDTYNPVFAVDEYTFTSARI